MICAEKRLGACGCRCKETGCSRRICKFSPVMSASVLESRFKGVRFVNRTQGMRFFAYRDFEKRDVVALRYGLAVYRDLGKK